MSLSPTADLASRFDLEAAATDSLRSRWLGAALVVAAMALQAVGHVNCDTSWFMTFAEKTLDGAVPYVDVGDPNPPAAFVVEWPALVLARVLGLHAEAVVVVLTALAALTSIGIAGWILRRGGLLPTEAAAPALNAAAFALLLVPALCFAEREHVVLILLLPFLAVCAVRLRRGGVDIAAAAAAGVGAGLALTFKPYYALPIGLAALCAPAVTRRWRSLVSTETVALAVTLAVSVGAVLALCPAYLETLAIATDVYGAAHETISVVLQSPAFLTTIALLSALLITTRGAVDPRTLVAGVASLGFVATYLVQAKGWMNHAYPGLALALIASAFSFMGTPARGAEPRRRFALYAFLPACLAAPLFLGAFADLTDAEDYPGLTAAVARVAPPHPRVAALAQELGIGHPLVRRLEGTWVGRQNCLWLAYAANVRRGATADTGRRAHLQSLIEADASAFAQDVAVGRPDVLLVGSRELEGWARRQHATAHLFDGFTQAGGANGVEIWLRRAEQSSTPAPAPQPPRP